jgi:hypothetical protein
MLSPLFLLPFNLIPTVVCETSPVEEQIFVDWEYAVEIEGDIESANSEFEFALAESMAEVLFLNCPTRLRRKLQENFGISAMDSSPVDLKKETGGVYLFGYFMDLARNTLGSIRTSTSTATYTFLLCFHLQLQPAPLHLPTPPTSAFYTEVT